MPLQCPMVERLTQNSRVVFADAQACMNAAIQIASRNQLLVTKYVTHSLTLTLSPRNGNSLYPSFQTSPVLSELWLAKLLQELPRDVLGVKVAK